MLKNTKIFKNEKTMLEKEIDDVLLAMRHMAKDTDEYEMAIDHLERLYKMNSKDNDDKVSPDTMAVVVGNLVGILLILKHEEVNVVTSKALNFVIRGRA